MKYVFDCHTFSSGKFSYSADLEKRADIALQDFHKNTEISSTHIQREVLLIKNQLEDMNICLRDISFEVKEISRRTLEMSLNAPILRVEHRKENNAIDSTASSTATATTTSSESISTDTSTQTSSETDNSQKSQHPPPNATNTSS